MGKLRIKYDKYLKKYFGYDSLKVLQFKIIYYIIQKKKRYLWYISNRIW